MKSLRIIFWGIGLLLLCMTTASGQGVTTAGMNGKIVDPNEGPLIGATVVAIHESTGSQFGTITDTEGYFHIPNFQG